MPDDAGGTPFPDGDKPDEHEPGSHGRADEEFASVVFDEDFIRAAPVHEPTAAERMLAAAQARAEAEANGALAPYTPDGDDLPSLGPYTVRPWHGAPHDTPGLDEDLDPYGPYGGSLRPYRGRGRWHRPVAFLLAVVMGIGLVALALSAVLRGAASTSDSPVAPSTSHDGTPRTPSGSASADPRGVFQPELVRPSAASSHVPS